MYFVSMDAVSDSEFLPASIGSHLGMRQDVERDPFEQVQDFLAGRHILLVLDNFEHLTEGAVTLSRILAGNPNLKLLVTSRETLRLEEEHVFTLEGLDREPSGPPNTAGSEAVRLFVDRARHAQPRFDIELNRGEVDRICALVEGLPLAIELAASWVRLISCEEIANEIGENLELLVSVSQGTPPRHRSLRAVFETSWQRLTEEEQAALRKLAVLQSTFRREAAEAVAGAALPLLASLVDKSLLRRLPDGRLGRHPLLHQFTREKAAAEPTEATRSRTQHAEFFLDLAETAETLSQGKAQLAWFQRLEEELHDLRGALGYLERTRPALALRLAAALGRFWLERGYVNEGAATLTRLLRVPGSSDATIAKALLCAGTLLWMQGDHERSNAYFEESLAIAERLSEPALAAGALEGLARIAHFNRGDSTTARALYASGVELARTSGDRTTLARILFASGAFEQEQAAYHVAAERLEEARTLFTELENMQSRARVLNSLANVWVDLGEHDRGRTLHEECLGLARATGDKHAEATVRLNLGNDAGRTGDEVRAVTHFRESLALFEALRDRRMQGYVLVSLGSSFQEQGETAKAREALQKSLELQGLVGETGRVADAHRKLGDLALDQGDADGALRHYRESLGVARDTDDKWALVRVLNALATLDIQEGEVGMAQDRLAEAENLVQLTGDHGALLGLLDTRAALESRTGEHALAVQHLARANAQRLAKGLPRKPGQQREHEKRIQDLRERLGEAHFSQAWSEGLQIDAAASIPGS